jgi:hypothetical protein
MNKKRQTNIFFLKNSNKYKRKQITKKQYKTNTKRNKSKDKNNTNAIVRKKLLPVQLINGKLK